MLRNIIRTSRGVARRQINRTAPVFIQRLPPLERLNYSFPSQDKRLYSSTADHSPIEQGVFEEICNETLESLCDYFEEIIEDDPNLKGADVTYSDGVLTVALGSTFGTYVINRQTPNKQIWLSSPVSGPKRYDLILKNGGYWTYKHDGVTLHRLLQEEISKMVSIKINFDKCSHSSV